MVTIKDQVAISEFIESLVPIMKCNGLIRDITFDEDEKGNKVITFTFPNTDKIVIKSEKFISMEYSRYWNFELFGDK
jgi:ribosomal protein S8